MQNNKKQSGLRDNHDHGTVAHFFQEKTKDHSHIAMVTAYFTVFAYTRMKPVLDRTEKVRLLFGDPAFIGGFEAQKDRAMFTISDEAVKLLSKLEQRASVAECIKWFEEQVEVRSVIEPGFLHGKMTHISSAQGQAHAIVGSSNFTVRGLGLAQDSNNVELNLIASDDRDREGLLDWFNQLWDDKTKVQDVREQVLAYLRQCFEFQSPEFIYQKTLFHVFGDQSQTQKEDEDRLQRTGLKGSAVWNTLFEFQQQGARGVIKRLEAHGGCILADSVGLGKTFTALAVIKYFEARGQHVLVLCPKKLEDNWRSYLFNAQNNPLEADKLNYHVQFHTDLGRAALTHINWGVYDLVVIDESHNFRNNRVNSGATTDEDSEVSMTRYQFLMEQVIKRGAKSKLLLLSATPVNNSLTDLRNQMSLIARADVSHNAQADADFAKGLGLKSVNNTVKHAQKSFLDWAQKPIFQRSKSDLTTVLGGDFTSLLDQLSIARSRDQIKRFYAHELNRLGGFPKRSAPKSEPVTQIDTLGEFPNYDTVAIKLGSKPKGAVKSENDISLAMFCPSDYLKKGLDEETSERYQVLRHKGLSQATRESTLVAIMRVLLLKRLESSVHSFTATLGRTIANIDALITQIETHAKHATRNPLINLAQLTPEQADDLDDELKNALEIGKKLKYKLADMRLSDWKNALEIDKTALSSLYENALKVTAARDQKLAKLKALLTGKITHPTLDKAGNPNRKVLVFTAFADTAQYLYDNLAPALLNDYGAHCGLVLGGFAAQTLHPQRTKFNEVLADFSPVSKHRKNPQNTQITVLIATDCISEGQNLQDCDTVINYDIHWNPVRIIQRFGRIDRIGSQAATVHMVNFWPTDQLDKYIKLKDRVEARMALVDIAATGSDNLLDSQQIKDLTEGDLSMRDAQLQRLQTEVFDLDDDPAQVGLADLSLDEFRQDLNQFLDAQRTALEKAPLGLFAVVPTQAQQRLGEPASAAAQAGVLFCLRQQSKESSTKAKSHGTASDAALNPLHDYYLAYVRSDGTVQLSHAQAKAVLNLWRALSAGQTQPYDKLCHDFDNATSCGKDMNAVSALLQAATRQIKDSVQGAATAQITLNRDFKLPAKLDEKLAENAFELVTWLVVRDYN